MCRLPTPGGGGPFPPPVLEKACTRCVIGAPVAKTLPRGMDAQHDPEGQGNTTSVLPDGCLHQTTTTSKAQTPPPSMSIEDKTIYDTPPAPRQAYPALQLEDWHDRNGRYKHHIYQTPQKRTQDHYLPMNRNTYPVTSQPASANNQGMLTQKDGIITQRLYKAAEVQCLSGCVITCCLLEQTETDMGQEE